ncbi:MAG: BLUF domain-containing protein [Acetobacteraceae bacterium]|nr:BLUF domain-containing protein [Acetobacteraceae bacterium]
MSHDLLRILYVSRKTTHADPVEADREVADILVSARRNNERLGVTGALLFSEGCFAQVLEGPTAAVEDIFERIQCDPRHDEVTVLEVRSVPERAFANWSMAYAGGAQDSWAPIASLPGLVADRAEAAGDVLRLLGGVVRRHDHRLVATA